MEQGIGDHWRMYSYLLGIKFTSIKWNIALQSIRHIQCIISQDLTGRDSTGTKMCGVNNKKVRSIGLSDPQERYPC